MSILQKSSSISLLYSKSSKRSSEAIDPQSMSKSVGEEVKGEEVSGYEGSVPLARGDE